MASRVFTASYSGTCGQCLDWIDPGDNVQYVDDELIHEDCNPEIEVDSGWSL